MSDSIKILESYRNHAADEIKLKMAQIESYKEEIAKGNTSIKKNETRVERLNKDIEFLKTVK